MNIDSLIKKTLHQSIQSQIPYSTGLNSAYKLVLADGSKVFIKYQKKADELLLKEAKELQLLEQFIKVPEILYSDEYNLILSFIETDHSSNWVDVGKQLARLHNQEHNYFGFEFDNKIGSTPQNNAVDKQIDNWSEISLNL